VVCCNKEPAICAQNFGVNADSVGSTSAEFYWDAVYDDPLQVHGIFRGYQVSCCHLLQSALPEFAV